MSFGVVISLPEPQAERVRRIQEAYGESLAGIPPHITLLSLAEECTQSLLSNQPDWTGVAEHVREAVRGQGPFTVALHGAETFHPVSPVAYIRIIEGADLLARLARSIRSGPLDHTPLYEYVPHVTLVHPGDEGTLDRAVRENAGFRDRFEVASIGLYTQSPSGRWEHREEIPLVHSPQAPERAKADSGPDQRHH